MNSPKKILLIGCGHYAQTAHIPALKSFQYLDWLGIVDIKPQIKKVQGNVGSVKTEYFIVPKNKYAKNANLEKYPQDCIKWLEPKLPKDIDAAIIATRGGHFSYTKWALERGMHTLVDKPLTIVENMAIDPRKAPKMVRQFHELIKKADQKDLLFMLATQRRYHPFYHEIASELRQAHKASKFHISSIQAFTSDGYYKNIDTLKHPSYGGKIKNTGYHILDIVPWLMRHTFPQIDEAVIQVVPLFVNDLAELRGHNPKGLSGSELYASIQITFRYENKNKCVFQFHAQHEGFSMRGRNKGKKYKGGVKNAEAAYNGRTKEEELRISMGPFFRAYSRRVAKIFDQDGKKKGENNHCYYEFSKSYKGIPTDNVFQQKNLHYEDLDSAPCQEFLNTLLKENPAQEYVMSPVKDHSISIKLFAGIYESIANVSQGNFEPVLVKFSDDEWKPLKKRNMVC